MPNLFKIAHSSLVLGSSQFLLSPASLVLMIITLVKIHLRSSLLLTLRQYLNTFIVPGGVEQSVKCQ